MTFDGENTHSPNHLETLGLLHICEMWWQKMISGGKQPAAPRLTAACWSPSVRHRHVQSATGGVLTSGSHHPVGPGGGRHRYLNTSYRVHTLTKLKKIHRRSFDLVQFGRKTCSLIVINCNKCLFLAGRNKLLEVGVAK